MTGRGWLLVAALAIGTAAAAGCGGGGGESAGEVVPPPEPPAPPDPPDEPPPPPPPPEEPGFQFGTQGPWPIENAVYGSSHGIREFPVVGVTTDEAQNRWVATHSALYLLRPGETAFQRFDEHDGLHMGANRVRYCGNREVSLDYHCTPPDVEFWGGASSPGISVIAGGAPDEVFVGYFGADTDGPVCPLDTDGGGMDYCDPLKHSGKIDRVRLNADGTLTVDRFDLFAINHGSQYWHNRTIQRLLYDHFANRGALYAGADHGVSLLFPERFRLPAIQEVVNTVYGEWMGDHLHARVCYERNCDDTSAGQRMGDWRGLALDGNGDLWHAGRWTAGLITYDPDPVRWFERNGAAFKVSFGDPYGPPGDPAYTNPPVFRVAQEGHSVFLTGVAVCPDGRVWFSSSGPDGPEETVAVYDGRTFGYFHPSALGLPERPVRDIACLPDGRLVLAGFTTGLAIHDPATGASRRIVAGDGIPSNGVRAIEVDRMADPPALHVATDGGAAVLRVIP